MTRPARVLLGTDRGFADRCRVYRTAEALEVDLIDHYDVQRRRVFFDEVQLVTLHSRRGVWRAGALLACAALTSALTPRSVSEDPLWGKLVLGLIFGVAVLAVFSIFIPASIVTVFGKRTRARMRFNFRPAKARRVYAEICQAAATAQTAAAQAAAPPAQEPPEPPPMPAEPHSPP